MQLRGLVTGGIGALAGLLLAGTAAAADNAPSVAVETVERRAVTETFFSYGSLSHGHEIEVVAEQSGRAVSILFTDGQTVEQGQPLVKLDDRQAKADLDAATARLATEDRNFGRVAQLAKDGYAAAAKLDEARAALDAAKAQVDTLRRALDRLTVRAPFAGMVGKRKVEQGAFLAAGQSIVTLRDDGLMRVVYKVPERMIPVIRPGQPFTAASQVYPDVTLRGRIALLDPAIDVATRSIEVTGTVDAHVERMIPGMFVTVRTAIREIADALVVPGDALVMSLGGSHVFRVKDGIATRVPVEVVLRQDGIAVVTGDLAPGDTVATVGLFKLADGGAVRVVAPGPATGPRP